MRAIQEIREERDDVFSFWVSKKQLNETKDSVIEVDEKLEECTILEIEKRIKDLELEAIEVANKIVLENNKIELIKKL
tara:strand:- start:8 stop:241 length:234 start_codon:yes stop_codon:yes gene_type:complete